MVHMERFRFATAMLTKLSSVVDTPGQVWHRPLACTAMVSSERALQARL